MMPRFAPRGWIPMWALLTSLLTAVPAFCAAGQSPGETVLKELSQLTDKQLPGVAILIARDGKILFQGGFGLANLETREPITPDTKFRIGSVTKQFTAAAILRLVEEGKLDLADPLEKFFPGIPDAGAITLHHLLTHTSGLHSYTDKRWFLRRVGKPVTPGELIAWFRGDPPDFAPGAGFHYCNGGYFLLGEIAAKVSGKSYGACLKDMFFDPLGMRDTGVYVNAAPPARMAVGYAVSHGKAKPALDWDMSWAGGAGAIYSTVGDLFRWNEALFGGRVLKESSLRAMTTPVKLPDDVDGMVYGYGLGVQELGHLPVLGHSGGLNGWSSDLLRLPEQHCTVVALANAQPVAPGFEPAALTRRVARKLFEDEIKRREPLQENAAVDRSSWPDFVGRYDYVHAVMTVTREGSHLYAQVGGQPRHQIFPKAENEFFWKVADASVVFLRNEQGEVVAARHTQHGNVFRAPRLGRFQIEKRKRDMCLSDIGNFAVPMFVLCSPIWFFGRRRVKWTWLDFSVAWLPFVVWFGLLWLNWKPMDLFRTVEASFVGALTPLCPTLRLVGRKWMGERKMACATAVLGAALACAVYFLAPCLRG